MFVARSTSHEWTAFACTLFPSCASLLISLFKGVAALRTCTTEMNCSVRNTHCLSLHISPALARECYNKNLKGILFHCKFINLEAQFVLPSLNLAAKIGLDPVCFGGETHWKQVTAESVCCTRTASGGREPHQVKYLG